MASSTISPAQALKDLMGIMNIEQNNLGSDQQIKKAYAKAREYLPDIEEWENMFNDTRAANTTLQQ